MSRIRDQYTDYINWAMGITFSVAAFFLTKDMLLTMLQDDIVKGILTITLLLVTVTLFFLYLKAVRTELDLLDYVLKSEDMRVNEMSGNVLLAMVALSAFFGVLIANTANILYYSGIAAIYSIYDMYGQSLVIRNFNMQMHKKNYRDIPLAEEEAGVLFDYYVGKPLLTRIAATLALECIAFAISVYSDIHKNELGYIIAYIIMIITFIVGEVVISFWRKSRNVALQDIREQRKKELLSDTPNRSE